ncbi:MAG TPA: PAS domain S-box protein [Oscillatoriaceae cyanobacterium M33_DOE_052]|nr:PAS domain S-box protein [Oscillatoriaceae cyanobacterium M33_DOE_052]
MLQPLRLLIVEDSKDDAESIARELEKAGFAPQWERVVTEASYRQQLQPAPNSEGLQLIICDYSLPEFSAQRALDLLHHEGIDIPLIVVTSTTGEEVAVECMKMGAASYLRKDRLTRLGSAVQQALGDYYRPSLPQGERGAKQQKYQKQARMWEGEAHYWQAMEMSPQAIAIHTNGQITYANPAWLHLIGADTREQIQGMPILDVVPPEYRLFVAERIQRIITENQPSPITEQKLRRLDGTNIDVEITGIPFLYEGQPAVQVIARDITDRVRAEAALQAAKDQLEAVLDAIPGCVSWLACPDGDISKIHYLGGNNCFAKTLNIKREEIYGRQLGFSGNSKGFAKFVGEFFSRPDQQMASVELEISHSSQVFNYLVMSQKYMQGNAAVCVALNITEQKRAEAALEYRADLENLIAILSTHFINLQSDEIDQGINHALEAIGEFPEVDRSYLFQLVGSYEQENAAPGDRETYKRSLLLRNTHEWSHPRAEPQINQLPELTNSAFPWLIQQIQTGKPLYINSLSDLPAKASLEKTFFAARQVKSALLVPMQSRGQLLGFIGFESVREEKNWPEEIISLLQISGEIFANILERQQSERRLQKLHQELEQRVVERTTQLEEAVSQLQAEITRRRESEERFRNLVETSSDWVWEVDATGTYTYCSPKVAEILGYESEEILGKTPFDLMPPREAQRVGEIFGKIAAARAPFSCLENTNSHKDGRLVVLETSAVPIFSPDGAFRGYRGMDRDVTERHRVEEILRLQQRALAECSNGIVITDARQGDNPIIYVNKAFERMTGYTAAEAIGHNSRFLEGKERGQPSLGELRAAISEGRECSVILRNYRKDGTLFWNQLSISPIYDSQGNLTHFLGVQNDITQMKQAEDALRLSQEKLSHLLASSPAVIYSGKADGNWAATFMSENVLGMTGYEAQSFLADAGFWFSHIHPEDAPTVAAEISHLLERGSHNIEYRWQHQNGTYIWIRDEMRLVRDYQGNVLEIVGYWADISDRKEAEAALAEARNQLQAVLDAVPGFVSWIGADLRYLGANRQLAAALNVPQEEFVGQHIGFAGNNSDFADFIGAFFQSSETQVTGEVPVVIGGELCHYLLVAQKYRQGAAAVSVGIDITDRVRAEIFLQQQAERERLIGAMQARIRQSLDLDEILRTTVAQVREFLNSRTISIGAISDFPERGMADDLHSLGSEVHRAFIYSFWAEGGGAVVTEALAPGEMSLLGYTFPDEICNDNTAERYRQGLVNAVADTATAPLVPSLQEFCQQYGVRAFLVVPVLHQGSLWGLLIAQSRQPRQWQDWTIDSLRYLVEQVGIAIQQAELYRQVQTELGERQRAEVVALASLREKEVLLKEIHHRVKNNLQVISSLLKMQSRYLQDPHLLDMFQDSQNRIRSMALIHEKLYQSPDLARIDLGDYLRQLTSHLLRSYSALGEPRGGEEPRGGGQPQIRIELNVPAIFLSIDVATPCGLIVCELVSNALKYAFPEGGGGEILVAVSRNDADELILRVADTGVGLPPDMDWNQTASLGLRLVRTLATQLGADVTCNTNSGTVFELKFTEPKYKQRL